MNNLNMKNILKITIIVGLLSMPLMKSRAGDLSIVGITTKVGDIVFGQTTVTPSYQLYTWDASWKVKNYNGYDGSARRRFKYDPRTQTGFFETITVVGTNAPTSSNASFMTDTIALQNFDCTSEPIGFVRSTFSYSIMMTCTTTTSGMSPPTGPFDISFKTMGTSLAQNCDPFTSTSREFRKSFKVSPFQGYVTGRVGVPNYSFAWPFQCWAGYVYLY
jgi:hypothetical protein